MTVKVTPSRSSSLLLVHTVQTLKTVGTEQGLVLTFTHLYVQKCNPANNTRWTPGYTGGQVNKQSESSAKKVFAT